jgi:hypothetical protein
MRVNTTGVKPSAGGKWTPIPKGRYLLQIIDAEPGISSKGNDKVTVKFRVVSPEEVDKVKTKGREIGYHSVTFLPPDARGAGMALHFLKCIGEPYHESEELDVNEARWLGKKLYGDVAIDFMRDKQGQIKKNEHGEETLKNIVTSVHPGPDAKEEPVQPKAAAAPAVAEEEIPF